MSRFNVRGKVILISGSTDGLGLTMAQGLAKEGATVILNGRNEEKLNARLQQFRHEKLKAYGAAFDVNDTAGVKEALEKITQTTGAVDVLVNNAGIQIRGELENFPEKDWERVVHTNLTAPFVLSQFVVKGMIQRREGKIINICSLQSDLARPTIAPYAAAKGGLKMLTRAMATEWAKYNIQVNAIGPGYFKTAMTRALYNNPEFDNWLCSRTPSGRWGEPEELLGVLIFLSSQASSYINGQIIYVDGGMTACV